MQASFPQAGIERNHITSKMKTWKRDYWYLASILHRPGFGWNVNENRLVAQEKVWNDFVREQPQLRRYRDMQFSNFIQWGHIFGCWEN
ncbi:hypothetical protein RHMOL_Rhmol01G0167000 [Rhododendron molle]|uniref:Uncharacterized protein n=1 Tax=Rhododendron molle TaxID=49168 RepID=A0ACC0Q2Q2_RHOML|nr:hypothetical protein RHMOL_Rhmol01G0167000 [Rhododendron molle]